MKRIIFMQFLLAIAAQELLANAMSDEVIAFTGARTKLVWSRDVWCNEDYSVKPGGAAGTDLMLLDTDEGSERVLVPEGAGYWYVRISRSGKWVTWNHVPTSKTYIIDLTAANPSPKVLLDNANCSFWCVRAMWADPETGEEFVYCLDNYDGETSYSGTGIYKVPLSQNGTADVSNAVSISYQGGARVDDAIAVSADGRKLGGAFPWPDTKILDIASGQFDDRHNAFFGCQANLAPDNSYRFHHCEDEHMGVMMFGPDMSTDNWFVDLSVNLAGLPSATYKTDFAAPRWSNHVRFFTNTYPMCDNGECYEGDEMGFSPAEVQNLDLYKLKNFVLAKWASDFKTMENSILVCPDPRYKQWGGDAWIASGVVSHINGTVSAVPQSGRDARPNVRLTRSKTSVFLGSAANAQSKISIIDARGRVVHTVEGQGKMMISAKSFAGGMYVVSVKNGSRHAISRIAVSK